MLPRFLRLHRRQDIERVVRFGNRVVTPYMVIYWQISSEVKGSRIACVVGKRVSGSAVRRHRLQRLMRSFAKEVTGELQDGVEMVWVGQSSLGTINELELLRQSVVSYTTRLPFKKLPS